MRLFNNSSNSLRKGFDTVSYLCFRGVKSMEKQSDSLHFLFDPLPQFIHLIL